MIPGGVYLFGDYDNLGAFDPFLDIEGRECIELLREIEVATSAASNDIEADYKSCI